MNVSSTRNIFFTFCCSQQRTEATPGESEWERAQKKDEINLLLVIISFVIVNLFYIKWISLSVSRHIFMAALSLPCADISFLFSSRRKSLSRIASALNGLTTRLFVSLSLLHFTAFNSFLFSSLSSIVPGCVYSEYRFHVGSVVKWLKDFTFSGFYVFYAPLTQRNIIIVWWVCYDFR